MRCFRREFVSVLAVAGIILVILLAFPYSAIRFEAKDVSPSQASASFVLLSESGRDAALKAAKTTWQTAPSQEWGGFIRLPLGDLPEEEPRPFVNVGEMSCGEIAVEPLRPALPAWAISSRAENPSRLEPEHEEPAAPAFSREELLKLK